MNFAKEFASVGLHYNCSTCGVRNCSSRGLSYCCTDYFPSNMETLINRVCIDLRTTTAKTTEKRLKRIPVGDKNKMTCDGDTLDKYYVGMINDTLSQIRKGKTAYLFHLSQLQEIMRFEDIEVTYNVDGGNFAVRLKEGENI